MQIKVFKAGNMKDAMTAMKAELGDDAVILHSKKYKEGGLLGIGSREVVEITAAVEENSLPKKNEPPRLRHPIVTPNSLLTRYKTDGTETAIRNAESVISNEKIQSVEEVQSDEEKIQPDEDSQSGEEKIQPVEDSQSDEEKFQPVEDSQPNEEKIQPVEDSQSNEEKIQAVEDSQSDEEKSQPVEDSQSDEEKFQPVEDFQPNEEKIQPVDNSQSAEEKIQPVDNSQSAEEKIQPVDNSQSAEEKIQPVKDSQSGEEKFQPVDNSQSAEEKLQPVDNSQSGEEKIQPADESQSSQQNAILIQEQMAQTQAMIMAQFNQMQMMQQAAIAQVQAQAQAQVQAQEQMRLQQIQVQQVAAPSQNEEKIQRLEAEIAQMKALLAEVLGRGANKNTISLHEALKSQEVEEEILNEMAAQSGAGETLVDFRSPTAKSTLVKYLNEHVRFSDGIKLNRHGVRIVALLGTTGVGKTTTLAKIAAKFVLEQRTNAALITADTYRISAVEQLKTYSDILELPLEIVYNPQELTSALERHRDRELILIDTAGRSQHNEYQLRELEEFLRVNPRIEKHLVISATTKFTDARQIMNKFSQVEPDRIIFTKIDETSSLGMIINLLRDKKYSLSYITTGQSVPDDIERANADVLANFLFRKFDEQ